MTAAIVKHADHIDHDQVYKDFKEAVNMSATQLDDWLDSDDSKSVGWTHEGETESVGHQSGRHIIRILHKKKADLTDADYDHMTKVIGYVRRHLAQRPRNAIEHSNWRYSLMNWGHDPMTG